MKSKRLGQAILRTREASTRLRPFTLIIVITTKILLLVTTITRSWIKRTVIAATTVIITTILINIAKTTTCSSHSIEMRSKYDSIAVVISTAFSPLRGESTTKVKPSPVSGRRRSV